jgi:hypothetical protein
MEEWKFQELAGTVHKAADMARLPREFWINTTIRAEVMAKVLCIYDSNDTKKIVCANPQDLEQKAGDKVCDDFICAIKALQHFLESKPGNVDKTRFHHWEWRHWQKLGG